MMPVEHGWGKEQVLHRQCGIPCYGMGLFLGKKIMEKKICLSLLILCLVSESGCISFALCNHSQSKHGMKLFFDQTQYFYFNVLLFEVFSAEFLQIYTATADFIRWERRGKSH